ncbi:MAG: DNA polymerase III subunit delta', partial [Acidobacteria bacterium]|nr:DNA polymerase III subunit delta' [Acidobacteriota bacterium]
MPFRDVVGHSRMLALLARAVAHDTLPPALLLAGPAGVGKRRAALALAERLNCLAPADGDACGACEACRRIARGVHPDVIVVLPGESG